MKFFNNTLKSLHHKKILFLFIFTLGVAVLVYQTYINTIQTSIIENFSISDVNLNPSKISDILSNLFKQSCVSGCVSPQSIDKTKCNNVLNNIGKYESECNWICDNDKFDELLKNNPVLKNKLSGYKRCSPDNERKDCGSCRPKRIFPS